MTKLEFEYSIANEEISHVEWNGESEDDSLSIYSIVLKSGKKIVFLGSGQIGVDEVRVYIDEEPDKDGG